MTVALVAWGVVLVVTWATADVLRAAVARRARCISVIELVPVALVLQWALDATLPVPAGSIALVAAHAWFLLWFAA